jgi:co-chaperonin GroES (HSP10)
MAKRVFSMEPSEREKVVPMTIEELQKYLQNDGYDDMREKIYYREITTQQFEEGLLQVEQTITKLKKKSAPPTTTFKPWEDRLCIYPDEVEVMTKGGIYKPDTVQQALSNTGTVVAISDQLKDTITVGMRVCYGKYAGTGIPASAEDQRQILIVRKSDVFGEV